MTEALYFDSSNATLGAATGLPQTVHFIRMISFQIKL